MTEVKVTKADVVKIEGQEEPASVAQALIDFHRHSTKAKQLADKAGAAKAILQQFAERNWLERFERSGLLPEAPFKLVFDGERDVCFVASDRTDGAELKEDRVVEFRALLGDDAATVMHDETAIELCQKTLEEKGPSGAKVRTVIAKALGSLKMSLVADKLLTSAQADRVFNVRKVKVLCPGLVGRLPALAKKAEIALGDLLATLGGLFPRSIKG